MMGTSLGRGENVYLKLDGDGAEQGSYTILHSGERPREQKSKKEKAAQEKSPFVSTLLLRKVRKGVDAETRAHANDLSRFSA